MFSDLNVFKMAYAMATHAGKRQSVVSQNMANADTPGYQAREIEPFASTYLQERPRTGMQSTRAGHLNGLQGGQMQWTEYTPNLPSDPNNNSVSVEEEMLKGVEVKRQHDRALAIYKSSMKLLRASINSS